MNIQDIKQNYRIEEVIGRTINPLKRQGPELAGNCIFHNDEHASLKINPVKQIFKCFACGTGGDMFDFFTLQGYKLSEATKMITEGTVLQRETPIISEPEPIWEDATPSQNNLPNVPELHFPKYGKTDKFWKYTDQHGNVNGYVLRFDLPEGKKDVIPYTYKKATKDGISKTGWFWRGFEVKRPLYNLHELASRPKAIVLVVEGEKTADAAKLLFPQYVVTTWIGGGENVKNADLSPLNGRNIYLWPDNDLPGIHCMFGGWSKNEKTGVYRRINGLVELVQGNFKRIQNSRDFPKKWDVADADWTPEQAIEYLKSNRTDIPAISEHAPNDAPLPQPVTIPVVPVIPISPKPKPSTSDETPKNSYFKCLGFENNDQSLFVFFVYRTNVIIKLSASGISTANLLQLAPLNYWEGHYPKQTRSAGGVKFEINTIADTLISACSRIGIFSSEKIRGRGAWKDGNDIVIHCGDTLIVNGKYTDFNKHQSKYIYEAGQEIDFQLTEPLKKSEAYKLITILERLNWSREVNARLLAGWIVIAPLCGALHWRPHLWLTGASGTGKSWIMKDIIKLLLGNGAVHAQSETTEAGIRQFLKADALPVMFDEIESEDKRAIERVQSILNIMRASSTSNSGNILKGSAGGNAAVFDLKSCFAFASIGANLTQRSDISRISVLEIKEDSSPEKSARWKETQKMHHEIFTDQYSEGFRSRAIMMLPVILQNAKTFSAAAAAELGNQRAGDQIGALLAGAYSLASDKLISFEQATAWIQEKDWSAERLADSSKDEIKVINKIMDSETGVETSVGNRTRTIGELIMIIRGKVSIDKEYLVTQESALIWLKRLGMKVETEFLIVSDNSEYIKRVLSNTAYSKNYHTILGRVNGAEKVDNTRFGSHIRSKATKIPLKEIFGDMDKPVKSKVNRAKIEINPQTEINY